MVLPGEGGGLVSFLHGQEAIRVVDRRAVGIDRAFAAGAEAAQGQAGPSVGVQPGVFGRHFMDIADRRGVAVSARQISVAGHLLAAAETVGGAGRVARRVAGAAGGAGRRGAVEVGGDFSGRQFRSGEKGGSAVGKTKRGKGTKWMVLVDGGVPGKSRKG